MGVYVALLHVPNGLSLWKHQPLEHHDRRRAASHIKRRLIALELANDAMHLRLIIFSFPAGMRRSPLFCCFRSGISVLEFLSFVSASRLGRRIAGVFSGYATSRQILLELGPGNRFRFITPDFFRHADYLACCAVHRCFCPPAGSIDPGRSVDTEPLRWNRAIKAPACLSEINQHSSGRRVIEYSR